MKGQESNLSKYKMPAEMLKAMAHPVRLCILIGLLENGQTTVSVIRDTLESPQSTVSQQLGILRRAGLVEDVRVGKQVAYRIADPNIERIIRLMEQLVREE